MVRRSEAPAYYLYYGLGSKWFAVCFFCCYCSCVGFVGNMVQANSISIALNNAFHIPSYIIGIVLAAVVGVVIIEDNAESPLLPNLLVPFYGDCVYLWVRLSSFICFADQLPHVIRYNLPRCFLYEVSSRWSRWYVVMKYAIRYGVARGLFSNEAGMGSTPSCSRFG